MDLNKFAGRNRKKKMMSIPEWFTVDPHLDRFVLKPPKEKKKMIRFEVEDYEGCLPIFLSKVAGVTHEGRTEIIRKAFKMIQNGKGSVTPIAELVSERDNPHDKNAIKVMLRLVNRHNGIIMQPRCVGFVPKELSRFLRFADSHEVTYECEKAYVKMWNKWPSVKLVLYPNTKGRPVADDPNPDEPVRTPVARKPVTGGSIDDFRQALLNKSKRRER